MRAWDPTAPGILRLPSGRLLRGRALSRPLPAGPVPDFAVYLLDERPAQVDWETRWVCWPDFRLPRDRRDAWEALREAWRRAEVERVEVACRGGRGRTGTALACIAVLDGVPARDAVTFVRQRYDPRAVGTPWQRRYVARFPLEPPGERAQFSPPAFLRALLARPLRRR
jgi:protein-tyrosine phosphatase